MISVLGKSYGGKKSTFYDTEIENSHKVGHIDIRLWRELMCDDDEPNSSEEPNLAKLHFLAFGSAEQHRRKWTHDQPMATDRQHRKHNNDLWCFAYFSYFTWNIISAK